MGKKDKEHLIDYLQQKLYHSEKIKKRKANTI